MKASCFIVCCLFLFFLPIDDSCVPLHASNIVVYDPQGPLRFIKQNKGPSRGVGHFVMKWDDVLHKTVGRTNCGNGGPQPCPVVGYVRHLGSRFSPVNGASQGLPITANSDVVGPVGGFGWFVTFKEGAPRQVKFELIEVPPESPMMVSIAYPLGTTFTLTAHAAWCTNSVSNKCQEEFTAVSSIEKVRNGLGNTYHVDENGVITFRVIQTPQSYVGDPNWFLPSYDTVGKWGQGYALDRFERDGVRLPKLKYGPYLLLEAENCGATQGVYCTGTPAVNGNTYNPNVCSTNGYKQVAYDACCSTSNPSRCEFADGSTSI